ncbi:toxin-antitoxin system TumE family protein [Paenibacillus fonticola]|uniref:toxin-antitoxin system TumE family protein n=1 Tax=Paenibacillus fonticola TaxID=379896 RepID=UPI0003AA6F3A
MYFYNWVSASGEVFAKFHSEPHDEDKRYQTVTEPFHIHPPKETTIHNATRYPNFHHQELPEILEAIFIYMLASKKI